MKLTVEQRFIARLIEAWHSSSGDFTSAAYARLRDHLTLHLESLGLVKDGALTEAARGLLGLLHADRRVLVAALARAT